MQLFTPAKINLFLHVIGRRPDGYHDVATLMCPVGIYDRLTLRVGGNRCRIRCAHPQVPENKSNLAARAADRFFRELGRVEGVDIRIDKHIPVGAGLGGGSSNAAAVLKALNRHYGHPFDRRRLMDMGREIGADVCFFIDGRPALATGIGDRLASGPVIAPFQAVVVVPPIHMATESVYKKLNLGLTKFENPLKSIPLKENCFDVHCQLRNDLETVVTREYPVIDAIKTALLDYGALGALMTGSGSGVFGLFTTSRQADDVAELMKSRFEGRIFSADLLV